MTKIKEIKSKSILTKSGLPNVDFVINPYTGCEHGCIYCYARFIQKYTNHTEKWGDFVDIKINAPKLLPVTEKARHKLKNKLIVIGSVTDPYQPMEKKYKLTRKILKELIPIQPRINIITKSDLVIRDIDILKQFKNCTVTISLAFLDRKIQKELEPSATPPGRRVEALEQLNKKNIKTVIFISPILPEFTNWKKIIEKTKKYNNEYWFENFNPYPFVKKNVLDFIKKEKPELIKKYKDIYLSKKQYWIKEQEKIKSYCKNKKINCKIYFHL